MYYCAGNFARMIAALGGLESLADRPVRVESASRSAVLIQHHGVSPLRLGMVLVSVAFVRPEDGVDMTRQMLVFEVDPSDDTRRGWRTGAWHPVDSFVEYGGFPARLAWDTRHILSGSREAYMVAEWRGAARLFNGWMAADGYLDVALQIAADRAAIERAEQHQAGRRRRGVALRSA